MVRNGWYLQMIVLMYCLFYLAFKNIKGDIRKLSAVTLGVVLYCIICPICGLGSTWYECMLCLPVGLWYARYESRVNGFMDKYYWPMLLLTAIVFSGTFLLSMMDFVGEGQIPFKMLSSVSFVVMISLMIRKIPIQSKLTNFLGGYYMEIYVLQGLVLTLLQQYSDILSPFQHFILAFFGALLIAVALSKPLKWILGTVKK